MLSIYSIICTIIIIFIIKKYWDAYNDLKKYKPIIDLENMLNEKKMELETTSQQLSRLQLEFQNLNREVNILNDDHNLLLSGFYKTKYNFNDSKKYEERMAIIRERQKGLIKEKRAITCNKTWIVEGSKSKGERMLDRVIKLGLSAFNVQCDNEILKIKFDNIDRAEQKIDKIREKVNKLLEPSQCRITNEFFHLKMQELFLVYEYQQRVQEEREEQRMIKEQIREEEKAIREIERAKVEAEQEEERFVRALAKAKLELEKKSESQRETFLLKIADLEAKLKEAQENKERAISQAQMTKRGYIYIISNIGSFGENIFKIGMTRRLDPYDRVRELGDASVPFVFDVHAMILSENAPELEKILHKEFKDKRVNLMNERREFFNVDIKEIERTCRKYHQGEFKLTLIAEAKQYRQTLALKQERIAA